MFKFYNTLTRKKQAFKPMKDKTVLLYTCGPTVYDYAHIGNMRAFLFYDLLKRVLQYRGFEVRHIMNLTDVGHLTSNADSGEDKMEMGAQREKKTAWQVADFFIKAFFEDFRKLRMKEPDLWPRATDHIDEMIEMMQTLGKKGFTYMIEDGIYFDTSKFKDYGKLAKLKIKGLKAGARVEMAEGKKNPTDFALWKFSPKENKRDMEWDFVDELDVDEDEFNKILEISEKNPKIRILKAEEIKSKTGRNKKITVNLRGFPGWHLECSVMAMKYLGETIDIHCGGVDHIPVHHTNEIAQSESATGKKFSNFWMHNEFMMVDGRKMAKSAGNYYTLRDLAQKRFNAVAFRYLCMSSHYRSQMNFTLESLKDAEKTVQSINDFIFRLKNSGTEGKPNKKIQTSFEATKAKFISSLEDDMNMPNALAVLFKLMKIVNTEIDANRADMKSLAVVYEFFMEVNSILDVIDEMKMELTAEEKKLIELREQFRRQKDFKAADEIRKQLAEKGIILEDTPQGPRWKKVN